MPDTDLATLNDGERIALALLAQGHTAKSIAHLTGRSVTSVNERLREARRKTGVGSSRELARLLAAAQENRDKQIGVAAPGDTGPAPAPEAAAYLAGSRFRMGIPAMSLLIAGGAAALSLFFQSVPQAAPDPLIDGIIGTTESSPRSLHDRLHAEARDQAWAPDAEAKLRERYAKISRVEALRVVCASTLCEVAGAIDAGNDRDLNATMTILQGKALQDEVRTLGFKDSPSGSFGGGGKTQTRFVIYWQR